MRFRIHIGFKNIHCAERIQKGPDTPANSPDTCGLACEPASPARRVGLAVAGENNLVSLLAGCVWTEGVFRKKKLRIQKYPYTCGRGLRNDNGYDSTDFSK